VSELPDDGLMEPQSHARGVRDSLFDRVGVTSDDSWEYEDRGGLMAWAQAHAVIAICAAAFAWFAAVFVIMLVVDLFS
jgi:hypothetical protein